MKKKTFCPYVVLAARMGSKQDNTPWGKFKTRVQFVCSSHALLSNSTDVTNLSLTNMYALSLQKSAW